MAASLPTLPSATVGTDLTTAETIVQRKKDYTHEVGAAVSLLSASTLKESLKSMRVISTGAKPQLVQAYEDSVIKHGVHSFVNRLKRTTLKIVAYHLDIPAPKQRAVQDAIIRLGVPVYLHTRCDVRLLQEFCQSLCIDAGAVYDPWTGSGRLKSSEDLEDEIGDEILLLGMETVLKLLPPLLLNEMAKELLVEGAEGLLPSEIIDKVMCKIFDLVPVNEYLENNKVDLESINTKRRKKEEIETAASNASLEFVSNEMDVDEPFNENEADNDQDQELGGDENAAAPEDEEEEDDTNTSVLSGPLIFRIGRGGAQNSNLTAQRLAAAHAALKHELEGHPPANTNTTLSAAAPTPPGHLAAPSSTTGNASTDSNTALHEASTNSNNNTNLSNHQVPPPIAPSSADPLAHMYDVPLSAHDTFFGDLPDDFMDTDMAHSNSSHNHNGSASTGTIQHVKSEAPSSPHNPPPELHGQGDFQMAEEEDEEEEDGDGEGDEDEDEYSDRPDGGGPDTGRPPRRHRSKIAPPLDHIKAGITGADLSSLYNLSDLQEYCRLHGIEVSGKKSSVTKRILNFLDGTGSPPRKKGKK